MNCQTKIPTKMLTFLLDLCDFHSHFHSSSSATLNYKRTIILVFPCQVISSCWRKLALSWNIPVLLYSGVQWTAMGSGLRMTHDSKTAADKKGKLCTCAYIVWEGQLHQHHHYRRLKLRAHMDTRAISMVNCLYPSPFTWKKTKMYSS